MKDRPKDTKNFWLFLLFFLGSVLTIPLAINIIAPGVFSATLRPLSSSLSVLSTRASLQARVDTLEAQVSELSREISYLQATAEVLDDSTPVPTPTRTPRPLPGSQLLTLIVTVATGNVRTGPSTDYQVIGYVKQGQILNGPFSKQNGWYRFCCVNGDQHGWVSGILVREQELATPTSSAGDIGAQSQTANSHTPITSPPASLGVNLIYEKYLDAGGVPILAPADVNDKAMDLAYNILVGMVSTRHDLFDVLVRSNFRVILYNDYTTKLEDLPEFEDRSLDSEYAGVYLQEFSYTAAAAPAYDFQCNIHLIHEIAHAIDYAEQMLDRSFKARRDTAYQNAMAAGLWKGEYAETDESEYWAEAVSEWFSPSNGPLEQRDPEAADLVASVFGSAELTYTLCP
ncbi:MAG: SH3 domain-containing protein [Caldilineaceae bacterium]|nr:SH3 domain-containing protein [Caldilineaceae bacterium]